MEATYQTRAMLDDAEKEIAATLDLAQQELDRRVALVREIEDGIGASRTALDQANHARWVWSDADDATLRSLRGASASGAWSRFPPISQAQLEERQQGTSGGGRTTSGGNSPVDAHWALLMAGVTPQEGQRISVRTQVLMHELAGRTVHDHQISQQEAEAMAVVMAEGGHFDAPDDATLTQALTQAQHLLGINDKARLETAAAAVVKADNPHFNDDEANRNASIAALQRMVPDLTAARARELLGIQAPRPTTGGGGGGHPPTSGQTPPTGGSTPTTSTPGGGAHTTPTSPTGGGAPPTGGGGGGGGGMGGRGTSALDAHWGLVMARLSPDQQQRVTIQSQVLMHQLLGRDVNGHAITEQEAEAMAIVMAEAGHMDASDPHVLQQAYTDAQRLLGLDTTSRTNAASVAVYMADHPGATQQQAMTQLGLAPAGASTPGTSTGATQAGGAPAPPGQPGRDRTSPDSARAAVDPQDINLRELADRLMDPLYERLRTRFATTNERRNPTAR
jgi:hypothetical protein